MTFKPTWMRNSRRDDYRAPDVPNVSGCDGKIQYPSKAHARAAIRLMHKAGKGGSSLEAYRCRSRHKCGWHVGHRSRADKARAQVREEENQNAIHDYAVDKVLADRKAEE